MTETGETSAVRFGRTIVQPASGALVDQPVQAIVYAANSRGVMGAGPSGSVRLLGGQEIERELMAAAPLDIGTAIATGSGRLGKRGIDAVIHAVLTAQLGDQAELHHVCRALIAALELADRQRFRTLGIPVLGLSAEATPELRRETVEAIVETLIAHLRRGHSRCEMVIIASRFDDDVPMIVDTLQKARQRLWTGQR